MANSTAVFVSSESENTIRTVMSTHHQFSMHTIDLRDLKMCFLPLLYEMCAWKNPQTKLGNDLRLSREDDCDTCFETFSLLIYANVNFMHHPTSEP